MPGALAFDLARLNELNSRRGEDHAGHCGDPQVQRRGEAL